MRSGGKTVALPGGKFLIQIALARFPGPLSWISHSWWRVYLWHCTAAGHEENKRHRQMFMRHRNVSWTVWWLPISWLCCWTEDYAEQAVYMRGVLDLASAPRQPGSTCTGWPQCSPPPASSCLEVSEAERISQDQTAVLRSPAAYTEPTTTSRGRHRPRLLGGDTTSPPWAPQLWPASLRQSIPGIPGWSLSMKGQLP